METISTYQFIKLLQECEQQILSKPELLAWNHPSSPDDTDILVRELQVGPIKFEFEILYRSAWTATQLEIDVIKILAVYLYLDEDTHCLDGGMHDPWSVASQYLMEAIETDLEPFHTAIDY